jgi:phenylalanyl-tRNA synthetase alpha chain
LGKPLGGRTSQRRPGRSTRRKARLEEALEHRRAQLAQQRMEAKLAGEALDVTLPGRGRGRGGLHPISRTWARVEEIFRSVGFDVADGPEIETDWHSLHGAEQPGESSGALDAGHVLRRPQDEQGLPLLLRPHTSPMQLRYAKMHKPPLKVIAPGPHVPRRFRRDAFADVPPGRRVVDRRGRELADLKGVFSDFLQRFFESDDLELRFRPSYFRSRSRPQKSTCVSRRAAEGPAGSSSPAPARCIRRWCATSGSTPSATSASRSAAA